MAGLAWLGLSRRHNKPSGHAMVSAGSPTAPRSSSRRSHVGLSLYVPESKLLKGGYMGDYIGDYYKGY